MRRYKYWLVPWSVSNPPSEAWEGEIVYGQKIANSNEIKLIARPAVCWISLSFAFLTLQTSPYHCCMQALTVCILKTLCSSPDQVFISVALDTAQAVCPCSETWHLTSVFPNPSSSQTTILMWYVRSSEQILHIHTFKWNVTLFWSKITKKLCVSCHGLSKEHGHFSWHFVPELHSVWVCGSAASLTGADLAKSTHTHDSLVLCKITVMLCNP